MTNFIHLIERTAQRFEDVIVQHSVNLNEIHTPDFGWHNQRWFSQQFRLAHVEKFMQPKFAVLHTVIWPHITDPSPIFGFDIIASDTKATGVFFDLSVTLDDWGRITTQTFQEPRERPEWGDIFSDNWVACRPSYQEAEFICDLACDVLTDYLKRLAQVHTSRVHDVVKAHNRYSHNQRQNPHTTRVIRKLLGDQQGEYFINQILFPKV